MSAEPNDDEEPTSIGLIEQVTEPDGTKVDVNNITPDQRERWADHVRQELQNLDGANEVYLQGLTLNTHQSGAFELAVKTEPESEDHPGVKLSIDPRSFAQTLRHTLDQISVISNFETFSPSSITEAEHDVHNTNVYIIDVDFY